MKDIYHKYVIHRRTRTRGFFRSADEPKGWSVNIKKNTVYQEVTLPRNSSKAFPLLM